jgi:hypothetical protein
MLSIKGVYDGIQIKPLEEIPYRAERRVIITFLDEDIESEIDPIQALRGCAKRENLTEKLLKARKENLEFEAQER